MTVRQHSFYLDDDDWVALRHYCLDKGISVSAFVAQAARNAIAGPQTTTMSISGPTAPSYTLDAVATTGAKITTGTGAPVTVPFNPVRAVPKPSATRKRTRS